MCLTTNQIWKIHQKQANTTVPIIYLLHLFVKDSMTYIKTCSHQLLIWNPKAKLKLNKMSVSQPFHFQLLSIFQKHLQKGAFFYWGGSKD